MLTSLIDAGQCSGYSAITGWERMVDRGKEYIIIQKKNSPAFPPIPAYPDIIMLTAATLLSSPFLSVCIWQQLLWTTLKR